jgi:hypothetical protein
MVARRILTSTPHAWLRHRAPQTTSRHDPVTDTQYRVGITSLREMSQPSDPNSDEHAESPAIDAAEAWKAISLVNDWVKHAETKSAATLAAAGVVGAALFNLVKDRTDFDCDCVLAIAAPICGLFVVAASVFAVLALWPRLGGGGQPTSVLFFDHIARRHPTAPDNYIEELKSVVASPDILLNQLGQQVWAIAHVARRKYRWASWGLVALFGSALAISIVALDSAVSSIDA